MLPEPLTPLVILLRVGAALFTGFMIGLEREINGKAAGLRTTVLVCVSTTLVVIVAYLSLEQAAVVSNSAWYPDPNRVIQGILTGVGFIGAGNILRQGTLIRGLTTAAGLWYVTILGIAFGSGYYFVGWLGLGVALLVLYLLPILERRLNNERYADVLVSVAMDGVNPKEIRELVRGFGVHIERFDLHYDVLQKSKTIQLDVRYRTSHKIDLQQSVTDRMLQLDGVHQVRWDQQN
jgi:putative Mg2+ transporter-C (MgtC) family protein